jgi:hypothetical protein
VVAKRTIILNERIVLAIPRLPEAGKDCGYLIPQSFWSSWPPSVSHKSDLKSLNQYKRVAVELVFARIERLIAIVILLAVLASWRFIH